MLVPNLLLDTTPTRSWTNLYNLSWKSVVVSLALVANVARTASLDPTASDIGWIQALHQASALTLLFSLPTALFSSDRAATT